MPLYPFFCKNCQKSFELFLRMSDAGEKVVCPYCGATDTGESSDSEQKQLSGAIGAGVCGIEQKT